MATIGLREVEVSMAAPDTSFAARGAATLDDVVGAGSRQVFTHLHGFMGPRSYCLLSTTCTRLRPPYLSPYCGGFQSAKSCSNSSDQPSRRMSSVLAVAMQNDVEETWVRLTNAKNSPSQEDVEAALRWTLLFPRRRAMTHLLSRHADLATAERAMEENEAYCVHLADSVFKAEHTQSCRHQPRAKHVVSAVPANRRAEVVNWLLRACEAVRLDDSVLAGTVLSLDRYYAANSTREIDASLLHQLTLATLCTEMKLASADACPQSHREQILVHLSQGQATLRQILQSEADVLSALGFSAGVPTPIGFVRSSAHHLRLGIQELRLVNSFGDTASPIAEQLPEATEARVPTTAGDAPSPGGSPGGTRRRTLPEQSQRETWGREVGVTTLETIAAFLTELALYDVEIEYKYPHALLATAALGVALFCIGGSGVFAIENFIEDGDDNDDVCTRELHDVLVQNLISRCPDFLNIYPKDVLRECEDQLLSLWAECESRTSPWSHCYVYLSAKYNPAFSRLSTSEVISVASPPTPPGTPGRATSGYAAEVMAKGLARYEALYRSAPSVQWSAAVEVP